MLRRNFLGFVTRISVVVAAIGSGLYSIVRALIPDILYEPPTKANLGKPEAFPDGVTFIPEQRLFVVRDGNDFYTISAICTHLGCTVNYVPLAKLKDIKVKEQVIHERWEFSCPCHGSKYFADGTNYAGPAPKPLPRFGMEISPITGELVVDKGTRVDHKFKLKV